MNIKKHLRIIGVIIMSGTLLSACAADRVKLTENMLHDKYNEDFVVEKTGGTIFAGGTTSFEALCRSKNDRDIFFEATVYADGSKMYDKYKEALLGNEMKKIIARDISSISTDYAVIIDFESVAEDYDTGTAANIYNNSHDTRCNTVLAVNIDSVEDFTPESLYSALQSIYRDFGKTEGGFFLYFADSDGMEEIRECMDSNPEIDTTLFDACGEGFECTVENGVLTGSVTDLREALN